MMHGKLSIRSWAYERVWPASGTFMLQAVRVESVPRAGVKNNIGPPFLVPLHLCQGTNLSLFHVGRGVTRIALMAFFSICIAVACDLIC